MSEPVLLLWSGGKDSALALHALQRDDRYEVRALLTTMTQGYDRISMHGVRRALLEAQATSLGLPLRTVSIPQRCSNDDYEALMREALTALRDDGVTTAAAGDIFLADVRRYREELLARAGLEPLFPLWGEDTAALARAFIASGFRARTTCVDTEALAPGFAGRAFDEAFLRDLPASADPCGENGEFHTFVHDGPAFRAPVPHEVGETVLRDERFLFCDLVPRP